jgi:hypothetical protein
MGPLRKIATTGPEDGEEKVPKCNSLCVIYHFNTSRLARDLNHALGVEPNSIMRHRLRGSASYRASLLSTLTQLNAPQIRVEGGCRYANPVR